MREVDVSHPRGEDRSEDMPCAKSRLSSRRQACAEGGTLDGRKTLKQLHLRWRCECGEGEVLRKRWRRSLRWKPRDKEGVQR